MTAKKADTESQKIEAAREKYFTFPGLRLESGEDFGPVTVCYETYGRLNAEKTNAVLLLHALSGDAHAAGGGRPGWWEGMVGPGKAFDTDRYFVVSSNVLGGCSGTTGPSSINPETGRPYGLSFPLITIGDMVEAQKKLLDELGIKKLLSVSGGSMGGMQALAWLLKYPGMVKSVIPVATALRHTPQQIAFNEVGRQAIMADPSWNKGDYYGGEVPSRGLAVARMVGHITYMSDESMTRKFGRERRNGSPAFRFNPDFEVEGYLQHRGSSFVKRFDANTYLYITKAMDNFEVPADASFRGAEVKALVIAFKSDWLYPAYQAREIVSLFKRSGLQTTYCEIDSSYGHDAFLLEIEEQSRLISHFLKKLFYDGEQDYDYEI